MIDAPAVLVDLAYMIAVDDPHHPRHAAVAAHYRHLVDDYRARRRRPVALSSDLAMFPRSIRNSLFAAISAVDAAAQYRNAAANATVADPEMALNLVVMRREKIRSIATCDRRYCDFEVDVDLID